MLNRWCCLCMSSNTVFSLTAGISKYSPFFGMVYGIFSLGLSSESSSSSWAAWNVVVLIGLVRSSYSHGSPTSFNLTNYRLKTAVCKFYKAFSWFRISLIAQDKVCSAWCIRFKNGSMIIPSTYVVFCLISPHSISYWLMKISRWASRTSLYNSCFNLVSYFDMFIVWASCSSNDRACLPFGEISSWVTPIYTLTPILLLSESENEF